MCLHLIILSFLFLSVFFFSFFVWCVIFFLLIQNTETGAASYESAVIKAASIQTRYWRVDWK